MDDYKKFVDAHKRLPRRFKATPEELALYRWAKDQCQNAELVAFQTEYDPGLTQSDDSPPT